MSKGAVTGFVDESIRGQRYLISCVLIETKYLSDIRAVILHFSRPNRRIHFRHESDQTRAAFLETISLLKIESLVIESRMLNGVNSKTARAKCLSFLIQHVQDNKLASRLIIEDFSDSKSDIRLIQSVRKKSHQLSFEHQDGKLCPELWIADAIVWAFGLGSRWHHRAKPLVNAHFIVD